MFASIFENLDLVNIYKKMILAKNFEYLDFDQNCRRRQFWSTFSEKLSSG